MTFKFSDTFCLFFNSVFLEHFLGTLKHYFSINDNILSKYQTLSTSNADFSILISIILDVTVLKPLIMDISPLWLGSGTQKLPNHWESLKSCCFCN